MPTKRSGLYRLACGHEVRATLDPAERTPVPEMQGEHDRRGGRQVTELRAAETVAGRILDRDMIKRYGKPSLTLHLDRDGQPCTLGRWCELYEDWDRHWIGYDCGRGRIVSTIYEGMTAPFGAPRTFKSLVFRTGDPLDPIEQRYWPTEARAEGGHVELVNRYLGASKWRRRRHDRNARLAIRAVGRAAQEHHRRRRGTPWKIPR